MGSLQSTSVLIACQKKTKSSKHFYHDAAQRERLQSTISFDVLAEIDFSLIPAPDTKKMLNQDKHWEAKRG